MEKELHFEAKGFLKNGGKSLDFDNGAAVLKQKKRCRGFATTMIPASEVRYFDVQKNFCNNKVRIRFGYQDQIVWKGLEKEDTEVIRSYLSEHGAKLGEGSDWIEKGLDCCCCTRERIAVVDEGVFYKWKKGRKNQSTYVEWDKINVAVFPSKYLGCCNYIIVLGELDIVTKYAFPKAEVRKIREAFNTKGIGIATGKAYRPFIFRGFKEHFQNCLILTDKGVVAKMSKKSVDASDLPKNDKEEAGRTIFIPYSDISKIRNAKGLKGYFKIEGSITDLREQKRASVSIVMSKPFCWCLVKCKIKSAMKG